MSQLEPSHLLTTKLHPPLSAGSLVPRPRLLERLADPLGRRLTLISAPPGYGKTTLVKLWLDTIRLPYGWVSLDEHDADLATFASYVIAAVRTAYPDALQTTASFLGTSLLPDPQRLADMVLRDLAQLKSSILLVMDDYHAVQSQPVQAFMSRVVQHLPNSAHLVLMARSDPALPLAQLRAQRQMVEVRTADLRFSAAEAGALVREIAGEEVSQQIAALLAERTEGWPVGLHLASLSLRDSDDPGALAQRFAARSDRLVAEYLVSEVLSRLPDDQRRLIVRMSILDRICGPLCEIISEGQLQAGEGEASLAAMWQSNLFLVALDEEGRWYRFHQLFLELLRHQLRRLHAEETIAGLYSLAAAWCESRGLLEEAIAYAVRAGDGMRAARVVEEHLHEVLNLEDTRRLESWLKELPATTLTRPGILVAQAFQQHFRFRTAGILALVEGAEAALKGDPGDYTPVQIEALLGAASALRAVAYSVSVSAGECIASARQALDLLPPETLFAHSLAEHHYFAALQRMGRGQEAVDAVQAELAMHVGRPDARTFRLILALCGIHHAEADLPALQSVAASYRQVALESGFTLSLGWANACLGWVHYQRDELAEAAAHFDDVHRDRYALHGRCAIDGLTGLALALHGQGRYGDAIAVVDDLRRLLLDRDMANLMPFADALGFFLGLAEGEPALPETFAADPQAQVGTSLWMLPVFVAVRAHLRSGAADRLEAASALLRDCRGVAEARHARGQLIEIHALEALLHAARGEDQAALDALRRSILLGQAGGALRLIADAGPGLEPLLRQLQAQGVAPGYVARVLAACTRPGATLLPHYQLPAPAHKMDALLTNREIDVLLLLERRLTNKEIAEHLIISPDTVKKHTLSLYRKLSSENRRQAVAQARRLGILPSAPSPPLAP